ncbi:hypothetical protein L3i20_v220020 [Paenibacillus sp. L3-i20]|nr:hypothetical protein L3i20_v220020 [Paenibacillus sp. L3-i20]
MINNYRFSRYLIIEIYVDSLTACSIDKSVIVTKERLITVKHHPDQPFCYIHILAVFHFYATENKSNLTYVDRNELWIF